MQARANLRAAWRLFRSDDSVETFAAAVLVVATVGPAVWEMYKLRRGGG